MSNSTNSSMPWTIELTVAVFEYILCIAGIGANFILCAIIIRHKKTTFSNAFCTLVVALAIPDCVHLFSEILCALPAFMYGLQYTPKWFLNSCGYLADVSFWATEPMMLIVAINRYVAVCYYESYQARFTHKIINFLIALCFLACFVVPSVMYGCKCYYDFHYAWSFVCQEGGCKDFALDLNAAISVPVCIAIALIYVLIGIQHHRTQRRIGTTMQRTNDDGRRAKEIKLMFQFGLISSVLVVQQAFFWIFHFAGASAASEMILNFLFNLNCCISPFLYLSFGSEIRSRLPWKKQLVQECRICTINASQQNPGRDHP